MLIPARPFSLYLFHSVIEIQVFNVALCQCVLYPNTFPFLHTSHFLFFLLSSTILVGMGDGGGGGGGGGGGE